MIQRHSQDGIGHSVVELSGARHVHVAAVPHSGTDLASQLCDALGSVRDAMDRQGPSGTIVRQAVFVSDPRQIESCRRLVEWFHGDEKPATTYIPQIPCSGKLVAVEAQGLFGPPDSFRVERLSPQLVVASHNGVAWCHCENVFPERSNGSLHVEAIETFEQMARLLEEAGFRYSQVVRTWLYLGDIVGIEAKRQRYQELNRARADFYAGISFSHNGHDTPRPNGRFYPASTGIGAEGGGLTMSCLALAGRNNALSVVPLENPNQTSAYGYDARYGPSSPSFSRAVAVVAGDTVTVFISGTASITGAESRHAGDVVCQTHQTLDNIAALIAPTNLARHGIHADGATLGDLAHLRVYLKNPADYTVVRRICHERIGELPTIYTVADVCRPELLVEIEAVGFAKTR